MNTSYNEACARDCSTLEKDLALCEKAGFDYIEIRLDLLRGWLKEHTVEQLKEFFETHRLKPHAINAVYLHQGMLPDETPDWDDLAMQDFKLACEVGSAIGSGYELEKTPTRAEALIMLIRMLGEEKAALACTASQPFIDVPDWCAPYVAYAYERGYSNGVGTDSLGHSYFGTQQTASAAMYMEFMLRALGYSSTATTNISDALDRAVTAGVLTAGERTALQSSDFLRADVAYLSYYALSARTSGGAALSRKLIDAGVFTDADYRAAQAMVTTDRLA